jgi:hypothetical protein
MPRSQPRSRRLRAIAIELRRSLAYTLSWRQLGVDERLSVDLVEEEIAADPMLRGQRHERSDGSIVDFSGPGVLVAYRIEPGVVELLDLIDLTIP